uniref:YadA-like family protein n=1 Tax=Halomonas halocynthiae TaxID=176290 RepID=UPI000487B068
DKLDLADSALQEVVTQVDGTDVKTLTKGDNKANFVSGKNIELSDDGKGGINVATADDVEFTNTTINNDLSVGGVTKLGDNFTVNADNSVEYTGPINKDDHITNKKYVDNSVAGIANNPLTFAGDTGTNVERKLGETVNLTGGEEDETKLTEGNIGVVANGDDTLEVKLARNLDLGNSGSVMMGDTLINSGGLTITGGPSITRSGIDAGGKQITNVGSGLGGKAYDEITGDDLNNAVNVGDLQQVAGDINKNVAAAKTEVVEGKNMSVTESIGADGQTVYEVATADQVEFDKVDVGSVTIDKDNVDGDGNTKIAGVGKGDLSETSTDAVNGSQLWEMQNQITNIEAGSSKYFKANSKAADARPVGQESVAMGPQSVAQGNNSVAAGNGAISKTEGSVALGAGSVADREGMNGKKEAFSNTSVASTQGAVSVGSKGGERQITNVAGGTQNTDAVNVRQLKSVQAGAVNYDRNADGSVNYGSVTLNKGGDAAQIHNVAAGTAPTDAANVGQLQNLNQRFVNEINGVHNRIDEVERDANAGIAGVAAMGNAPYVPGKFTYHVGGGYHGGESAVGVNLRRTADNGRWSLTAGAAGSRAGATISLGISGVID